MNSSSINQKFKSFESREIEQSSQNVVKNLLTQALALAFRYTLLALTLLLLIYVPSNLFGQDQDDLQAATLPPYGSYIYAAKIICGTQAKANNLRLARGIYATAINVHNPLHKRVDFRKKLALAYPPGFQREGKIYRIAIDTLGPDGALEVDCIDIRKRLSNVLPPSPYFTGFVVFESRTPLDVTSVYTVAKLGSLFSPQRVVSIDVEQIKRSKQKEKPRGCPDLIPVPKQCNDPNNLNCFCVRSRNGSALEVTVKNQGTAKTMNLFEVSVDFEGTIVTLQNTDSELLPGDEETLTFPIPTGCFNPDCSFRITVDSDFKIEECDENNNSASGRCVG